MRGLGEDMGASLSGASAIGAAASAFRPIGLGRMDWGGRKAGATLRAALREPGLEADEVVDVEHRGGGRAIAVGVGRARCELVEEADEIVDVEDRLCRAPVAVGVAGAGA